MQAASCTYRIALGPRAGQKVLSLRTVAGRDEKTTTSLCADAHGFSLHAGVRCGTHQRKELERLCRYITRPASTTHIKMSPLEFMQRLAALVPRPRLTPDPFSRRARRILTHLGLPARAPPRSPAQPLSLFRTA